ncbi:MAG: cobalamin-independent methionine synthase II family protein [Planctomycetes bacterium]|nr:cobalamin-independent methionine synthase II family protein [Planctomycetota bacterium]
MNAPEVQTTVVGSYPVPDWLKANPSRTALRDAVMVVFQTQELAGVDVVADGELYRFDVNHPETNGMIDYFVRPLEGVTADLSREAIEAFRRDPALRFRAAPAGVVRGPIGEGLLNLPKDYEFVRGLTHRTLKFTVTGPHMLAKTLVDLHYRDRPRLAMAIAEVLRRQVEAIDAAVVQLDEANISGHPEEAEWAAEAVNHVLAGVRGQKAVHICFGNYGGQSVQKGLWAGLLPFMNRLKADHLVLEFARRGYDEIEVFRDLRPETRLGLGVIDIKDNGIEPSDLIARRIEQAVKALGPGRLQYVHPDCGFWMLLRSVADRKIAALVQGRDAFLGRR